MYEKVLLNDFTLMPDGTLAADAGGGAKVMDNPIRERPPIGIIHRCIRPKWERLFML
jgi:hypothetical protein